MKGFCSGSSIEIDLELSEKEISTLEKEVIKGKILRGHDRPKTFIDINIGLGDTGRDYLMGLKVNPDSACFEETSGYIITLSRFAYNLLIERGAVIDRPILGTKVSIYSKN